MIEGFELAILFTAAGALVGAGLVKTLVSAAKGLGFIPEHGRAVMLAALGLSVGLIALALWGSTMLEDGLDAQDVFIIILSVFNIYAASVGIHESAVKIQRIASGTTNRAGADPEPPAAG